MKIEEILTRVIIQHVKIIREVNLGLKSRRLYTQTLLQTRVKRNKRKSSLYCGTYCSFVQRRSLLNFAIEALRPAWEDAPKNGAEPLSGQEMYVR